MRARIASAFDLMRRAAEGELIQSYAAKLAGLFLCLRPDEAAAAANRLRSERDAAIDVSRATWRERERSQIREAVGILVRSRQARRYHWRSQRQAQMIQAMLASKTPRKVTVHRSRTARHRAHAPPESKDRMIAADPK
jgi:hypothetical protein